MSPLEEKQQFHNELGGWLGVVTLNAKGEEVGVSVPPDGYVFLSEAEQRLTASAPRSPKDNPFIEQEFETIDPQTGERTTIRFVPLVPSNDDRFTPGVERPIPADIAGGATGAALAAHAATTGDRLVLKDELAEKEAAVLGDPEQPPVPSRAAEAAQAAQERSEPPTRPEEDVEGTAAAKAAEEHAAAGDATGAAVEPQGDAVAGSFAPGEEVGTPDSSSGVEAENTSDRESGPLGGVEVGRSRVNQDEFTPPEPPADDAGAPAPFNPEE